MPAKRRIAKGRRRLDVLTLGESFELMAQCSARTRHFQSERERREAWLLHRDELLSRTASCRRRPSAWWAYDVAPEDRPRLVRTAYVRLSEEYPQPVAIRIYEHETECLIRLGLATADDLSALRRDVDFSEEEPYLSRYSPEDLARMRAALAAAVVMG
jgi:hypothetical protein